MRVNGWEKALKLTVERHASLPGAWGQSDCWMLAVDAYQAVTGEKLAPKLRGYKTEAGGYKLFAKHGFKTVGAALAAHLPAVPTLMAQRGDLGVIERRGIESCGVVTTIGVAVKTEAGLTYLPVTELKRAFKVG